MENKKSNPSREENKTGVETKWCRDKEAAEYMRVGVSTIWLYVKQGELSCYRVGKRVTIFNKEEIDLLITSKKETK